MSEDYEDILAIRDEEDDTGQEWLTTLADLSMLLLVFFVLLYSMSTIDTEKFSETFSSVTQDAGASLNGKRLGSFGACGTFS
ncbi:MAG: DegT/DnrJ/EryC1/StrS family aminotransferase, partial [Proteobacteria bacterium]|nr:DegT/DnrJ/EryC1/StrS family aminotransferase [Pseudomonadota bacterium]